MGYVKRVMAAAALFLLLSIACAAIFYGHIAAFIFARSNNIDISYKQVTAGSFTEFIFKDLKVAWRRQGAGLSSSGAGIKLIFDRSSPPSAAADFILDDVQFIKKGSGKEISYNDIDGLIAAPFSGLLKYKTVSGKIGRMRNGISLKDFMASGDQVRFSFDGTLTDSNIINADIKIYFAEDLAGRIPPELTGMVLTDESDGWKSFSLKLEGDLSKPSMRVTGKLFRLNIGVKQ